MNYENIEQNKFETKQDTHLIPQKNREDENHISYREDENRVSYEKSSHGYLDLVQSGFESLKYGLFNIHQQNKSQYQDLKNDLEEIKDAVVKKPKAKTKAKPLREPVTMELYEFLVGRERDSYEHRITYSRFRVAITILFFTGLRINEIRTFTRDDIKTLASGQVYQVYQPKTNKYKKIYFSKYGCRILNELYDDIELLFSKSNTLGGELSPLSWIRFLNNRLVKYTSGLVDNIRSHSFRVNYATNLLKITSLQEVAQIIGHADIKTTLRYNRYKATGEERLELINKTF